MTGEKTRRLTSLFTGIVMFGSTAFAGICWYAALGTFASWGVFHWPVIIAAVIATVVAVASGIVLFRNTNRWPR